MVPSSLNGLEPISGNGLPSHTVDLSSRGGADRLDMGRFANRLDIGRGEFKPLEFTDQGTFREFLKQYPQWTSEMSFANLFAWAPTQYPRFSTIDGHLLVSYDPGNTGACNTFLSPIGPRPVELMARLIKDTGAEFVRVDHEFAAYGNPGLKFELTPSEHDYLYTAQQILTLQGSQASELRRRSGKFIRNFGAGLATADLSTENLDAAHSVADRWLEGKLALSKDEGDRKGKLHDSLACKRILERWDSLANMRGTVTFVNGKPVAVCIGEMVHHPKAPNGLFISHFEKADPAREYEGLTVCAFQEMIRRIPTECIVNRMQSAGNPGLEVWKKSWGPIGLGMKSKVTAAQ